MIKSLKIITLALTMVLAVTFTSCSSATSGGNNDDSGSTNPASVPTSTYTVTYVDGADAVEITVPSDSTAYHTGDNVTIKFDGIGSRIGYKFVGWSDGTTAYTSNGTTSIVMGSANVTLTAQWTEFYFGTKVPSVPKEVGDIVFSDGSSMPYTDYAALAEGEEKTAKKNAAIALIYYKGTGLNCDLDLFEPDNTISRTLGVGLKNSAEELSWCIETSSGYAPYINSIICLYEESDGVNDREYTFIYNKNGSDNLEKMAAYFAEQEGVTDDTSIPEKYPAFYWAKNYKDVIGSNVRGSAFEAGWFLPSIAELYEIWKSTNVFNLDAAREALGGDRFVVEDNIYYWSSSESNVMMSNVMLANVLMVENIGVSINNGAQKNGLRHVCAIHEFN